MQKGSGLLWALERRGAMQLARFLLQSSIPSAASRRAHSVSSALPSTPRRDRRRPRPTTTLRLVLP